MSASRSENLDMDPDRRRWHVGKEIPVAVMVTLLIQTGGIVWWAAGISAKLDNLAAQVAEFKSERYTARDAGRDQAMINQRVDNIERRVQSLEDRRSPAQGMRWQ